MRSKLAVMALAAVLALGACGDDGGGTGATSTTEAESDVTAASYAQEICGSISSFKETVTGVGEDLQSLGAQDPSIEEARTAITDAFSQMSSEIDELTGEVEDTEVPDVEGAQEFNDEFVQALESLKTSVDDLTSKVEQLPSSKKQFVAGFQQLVTEFQGFVQGISANLKDVDAPEVKEALKDECPDDSPFEG